jgi:hypothetical protein
MKELNKASILILAIILNSEFNVYGCIILHQHFNGVTNPRLCLKI